MKIAVMSDSHDNIWKLRKALDIIKTRQCEKIIHCGDFVAPFMFKEIEKAGIAAHCVFGNNDGDRYLLTRIAAESSGLITLNPIIGEITTDEFKIGFTHEWPVAQGLAATGKYQMVCFGHSHQYELKNLSGTILLNPGDIMGKDGDPGFCIVDTATQGIQQDIKRISI